VREVVARLLAAAPPGSFVVISHAGRDLSRPLLAVRPHGRGRALPCRPH